MPEVDSHRVHFLPSYQRQRRGGIFWRRENQKAMASRQEVRYDQPAKEKCQVQIIVFQFPRIRDPSVGASLVEVNKIRPFRDSRAQSASLRAVQAFDRLPQVRRRLLKYSYFHDPIRVFPPRAMTSNAMFLHCA